MALADPYASAQEYREAVGALGTGDDSEITRQLIAVSREIERASGQYFNRTGAPVAHRFVGDGDSILWLDEAGLQPGLATLAGLQVIVDEDGDGGFSADTPLDVTTILGIPYNAATQPEPEPYRALQLLPSARIRSWPKGRLVEVTGEFGWPQVPGIVKEATIEVTAIWRGESPRATTRINELSQAISASPLAMSLVSRFAGRYRKAVVA